MKVPYRQVRDRGRNHVVPPGAWRVPAATATAAAVAAVALWLAWPSLAAAAATGTAGAAEQTAAMEQLSEATRSCLDCHESDGMEAVFPDGTTVDARVDPQGFASSVHGAAGFDCQTCHTEITDYPHPDLPATYREWQVQQQQVCAGCHGEGEDFDLGAHGRALISGDPDVPTCTTCHGDAHRLKPATSPQFRASIPETCARCHANDELMQAHNVMTGTVSSYLAEFHGMTATLMKQEGYQGKVPVAVCSDCHEAHRILPATNPDSSVYVTNLAATCRKCHPQATEAFATAWSMHRDPESHPLVRVIAWFYRVVTAASVMGFLGYIVLDARYHRAARRKGGR